MDLTEATYTRLLEELYARHPSVQNQGFTTGAYKPGLDGMRRLDAALGHPAQRLRAVHVAGTNGKGSVSSMLAAALSATGLRVGLYTSPHLVDFRERIKLVEPGGWSMIPREEVFRFLTERERDLEGLSFFEITTGLAFKWFADIDVDIAVIEVGLGGRLDSTNILTPELAVVTSIGLDHCALLGGTRGAIAAEKAGIFKPGVPALCGERDAETEPVFEARASVVPCPLFFAEDFDVELFDTDLTGPYQAANLRTALAALELLGIDADREALAHTAARTGSAGAHGRPHRPARPLGAPLRRPRGHLRHRPQPARADDQLPAPARERPAADHRLRHHGRQGPGCHPPPDAPRRALLPRGAPGRARPARRGPRRPDGRLPLHRLRQRTRRCESSS